MNPNKFFRKRLISWYLQNKRDLPWRNTNDPYMIWLSEIILQQTRVSQGLPYFLNFIAEFPTVFDLAKADETKVLRLWQGLGYYSRARNLHACARAIVEQYNGKFPNTYDELLQLKGVGKYTAAAIASFAFHEVVPVVDGNVYRVLSRIFGVFDDIASGQGQKVFAQLAAELIDRDDPHNYNQAIMEFGAIHCTPTAPACDSCIFSRDCHANKHSLQQNLPVKTKKVKVRSRFFHYLVIQFREQILLRQRQGNDIWKGLYDFYLIEENQPLDMDQLLDPKRAGCLKDQDFLLENTSGQYKHVLTHQRIFARFFHIKLAVQQLPDLRITNGDFQLYTREEINDLPKPILIDNYLNEHIF
ncbi:A/G-specific adenine glycosylase [Fulvivirgaceae bacterium BMA12]|uniref:Adenine DNA glycosylase n=1 Tax=Agaribacillus aureus TaxID=3051825 RepID=A0ABT8LDF8_9BACT|nr:A/G-specific adenine glycosylase [Fulvivirgaceae bacterium BMA12]